MTWLTSLWRLICILTCLSSCRLPPAACARGVQRGSNMNKVSAEIGENVILDCGFDFPDGIPVPYVVQWQKLDNKIPIYIW
jgi:hypothetical protein